LCCTPGLRECVAGFVNNSYSFKLQLLNIWENDFRLLVSAYSPEQACVSLRTVSYIQTNFPIHIQRKPTLIFWFVPAFPLLRIVAYCLSKYSFL
jgi:hypothetical protein